MSGSGAPRVLLVGAAGYGSTYVDEIARLEAAGEVELAGICDRSSPVGAAADLLGDRPWADDLGQLLVKTSPDVVVVATPIPLHLPMARQVLDAGARLLLEKPPTATLADWRALCAHPGPAARQVGFQSLGSSAVPRLRALVESGALGQVRHVGVRGAWQRTDSYYARAAWAGRRTLEGVPVADGVWTNPFAHGLATGLAVLGSTSAEDVTDVRTQLWRTRDIECDDTAWVRVETTAGVPVVGAATLCADEDEEPAVVVAGTGGTAVLHYTADVLEVDGAVETHTRTSPLQDLLRHGDEPQRLQSSLADCGAFMQVLEALRLAPPVPRVPEEAVRDVGVGGTDRLRTLPGITAVVRRVAREGLTLEAAGRPW
ncbi:Gfo/Idh/MocA family protein [Nocardioides bruguierae]|uniref:Gfo/Idh/MocA family protein n=1 Tax=Nocardioides bruguierae TaxID=2945102 RepID=UPI00202032AD|nr:Gfo/Idh/MocA family oxidoreductase [Nocardioides bruguierae]MCL8026817.1 Gfo/Idh/MocA family oxidoreductase [Nocardioides bruguierae]